MHSRELNVTTRNSPENYTHILGRKFLPHNYVICPGSTYKHQLQHIADRIRLTIQYYVGPSQWGPIKRLPHSMIYFAAILYFHNILHLLNYKSSSFLYVVSERNSLDVWWRLWCSFALRLFRDYMHSLEQ